MTIGFGFIGDRLTGNFTEYLCFEQTIISKFLCALSNMRKCDYLGTVKLQRNVSGLLNIYYRVYKTRE